MRSRNAFQEFVHAPMIGEQPVYLTPVEAEALLRLPGARRSERLVKVENGPERIVDVREIEVSPRTVAERLVEHEVALPVKVVREERYEKLIVIPEKKIVEEVVHEKHKVREKIVELAKDTVIEKTIEQPIIEHVEVLIEVPVEAPPLSLPIPSKQLHEDTRPFDAYQRSFELSRNVTGASAYRQPQQVAGTPVKMESSFSSKQATLTHSAAKRVVARHGAHPATPSTPPPSAAMATSGVPTASSSVAQSKVPPSVFESFPPTKQIDSVPSTTKWPSVFDLSAAPQWTSPPIVRPSHADPIFDSPSAPQSARPVIPTLTWQSTFEPPTATQLTTTTASAMPPQTYVAPAVHPHWAQAPQTTVDVSSVRASLQPTPNWPGLSEVSSTHRVSVSPPTVPSQTQTIHFSDSPAATERLWTHYEPSHSTPTVQTTQETAKWSSAVDLSAAPHFVQSVAAPMQTIQANFSSAKDFSSPELPQIQYEMDEMLTFRKTTETVTPSPLQRMDRERRAATDDTFREAAQPHKSTHHRKSQTQSFSDETTFTARKPTKAQGMGGTETPSSILKNGSSERVREVTAETTYVPVGVEAEVSYEFKLQQMQPRHLQARYQVYLPRFIEVPVAAELLTEEQQANCRVHRERLGHICNAPTSLCEIETLAKQIIDADVVQQASQRDLASAMIHKIGSVAWPSPAV